MSIGTPSSRPEGFSNLPAGGQARPHRQKLTPLYQVMKTDLERAIATGEFAPGVRVPSESELIASYNVSSTTARRCLDELEQEGMLRRVRGKGTFVSDLAGLLQHVQVAVLVRDLISLSHPFIVQALHSIEKMTENTKVHLNIQRMPYGNDPAATGRTLVSALRHNRIKFALVLSNVPLPAIQLLVEEGVHCLGVNTRYQDDRIPHIAMDFELMIAKTLRFVARLGHQRIAYLTQEPSMGSMGVLNSASFIPSAWEKARTEFPYLAPAPQILTLPYADEDHLPQVLEEAMHGSLPPTVIICSDEVMGLEVVRHLRRLGFSVPSQVSVTGFKLLASSELAVLEMPLAEMAATSARAMLGWVDGVQPQSRLFPPGEFLPRDTLDVPHHLIRQMK
jgi:GntR family transcriptional regulator, arabinose operon transcriptional repressor